MFAFLAPAALLQIAGKAAAKVKGGWTSLPPKAKLALLAIALLAVGYFIHQHHARKMLKAADSAGYARAKAEDAAALAKVHQQALEIRDKANRLHASISLNLKGKNDAEIARIDRAAADVLRGGPGKARCGRLDHPELSAGAGGRGAGSGQAADAVARVPDPRGLELLALPFAAAVSAIRQCDANRTEVLTWREADRKHREAWPTPDRTAANGGK